MSKAYYKDQKFLKKFGARLKSLRMESRMTQEQLANELGFSQSHIGKIEAGIVNTSISHANAMAKALKIPINTLFDF